MVKSKDSTCQTTQGDAIGSYLFFSSLFSTDGWVFWPLGPALANGGVEVDEGELDMMILLITARWNYTQSDRTDVSIHCLARVYRVGWKWRNEQPAQKQERKRDK